MTLPILVAAHPVDVEQDAWRGFEVGELDERLPHPLRTLGLRRWVVFVVEDGGAELAIVDAERVGEHHHLWVLLPRVFGEEEADADRGVSFCGDEAADAGEDVLETVDALMLLVRFGVWRRRD